jgi:hypothetical protein
VKVKVMEVDLQRKRIALAIKGVPQWFVRFIRLSTLTKIGITNTTVTRAAKRLSGNEFIWEAKRSLNKLCFL